MQFYKGGEKRSIATHYLLVACMSFTTGYMCKGCTEVEKTSNHIERKQIPLQERNRNALEEFIAQTSLDDLQLDYPSEQYVDAKQILEQWKALPREMRIQTAQHMLTKKSKELYYSSRDFIEDNAHELILFFLGGN